MFPLLLAGPVSFNFHFNVTEEINPIMCVLDILFLTLSFLQFFFIFLVSPKSDLEIFDSFILSLGNFKSD